MTVLIFGLFRRLELGAYFESCGFVLGGYSVGCFDGADQRDGFERLRLRVTLFWIFEGTRSL